MQLQKAEHLRKNRRRHNVHLNPEVQLSAFMPRMP
jgi:hypothetical protein